MDKHDHITVTGAAADTGTVRSQWERQVPSIRKLQELGPTTSLATAADLFGLSRATAYRLARTGRLPVPVLRAGNQYRVPVAPIIAALHPTTTPDNQPPPEAG